MGIPLNRPTDTFSPIGGEGWDEGAHGSTKILLLTELRQAAFAVGYYPEGITSFSPALPDNGGLRWVTNQNDINPEGVVSPARAIRCNPFRVENIWDGCPRVAPRRSSSDQPWAEGWNPVGIHGKRRLVGGAGF